MAELDSFRSVIDLWRSLEAMAGDIGGRANVISKWRRRDSIPSEWWESILSTEVAKASGLTADALAKLAARNCNTSAEAAEASP